MRKLIAPHRIGLNARRNVSGERRFHRQITSQKSKDSLSNHKVRLISHPRLISHVFALD
jgi:hypothetical protein